MEPVRLQPFEITREMFVPFVFRYKLLYSLARLGLALLLLAAISFVINPYAPIGTLAGGAVLMLMVVAARRSNISKMVDSPLNKSAFERRYVEFDKEEIRVKTERNARSFVPFACVAKIEEYEDRFLVFVTAAQMWMIPKTAFPDIQAIAEFREVARANDLFK